MIFSKGSKSELDLDPGIPGCLNRDPGIELDPGYSGYLDYPDMLSKKGILKIKNQILMAKNKKRKFSKVRKRFLLFFYLKLDPTNSSK
jgi:hypothetical protein